MENPQENLINAVELERAVKTAGHNLIVLRDLDTVLQEKTKRAGLAQDYQPIFVIFGDLTKRAEYLQELRQSTTVWDGDTDVVDELENCSKSYQHFRAQQKFQEIEADILESKLVHIKMIYDITPQGQFVRGYELDNRTLDPAIEKPDKELIDAMDEAFHTWMRDQHMVSKGGLIYAEEPLDNDGNPTKRVSDDNFIKKLTSPEPDGFVEVAKNINSSINLTLQRQQAAAAGPEPQK